MGYRVSVPDSRCSDIHRSALSLSVKMPPGNADSSELKTQIFPKSEKSGKLLPPVVVEVSHDLINGGTDQALVTFDNEPLPR